jgi:signal transduction histidine kinase
LSRSVVERVLLDTTDWFIPASLHTDTASLWRMRIFVVSHLFGPWLGALIVVYLFRVTPTHDAPFWIVVIGAALFWTLPVLLKLTGWANAVTLLSVADLTVISLFGSFFYGGASSPFLVWMLVALLLGFFYLGERKLTLLAIFGTSGLAFSVGYLVNGGFPTRIDPGATASVGLLSLCCATIYTAMMAAYYATVVAQQSHLEQEARRHLALTVHLRKKKEEAERANQDKSAFLAKMSHQLRTPLNAVIGYSEILLEDAEEAHDGQQVADLRRINNAGTHLLSLVTDVLDISKLQEETFSITVQSFDLRTLVEDVAETFRSLVVSNGNQFDIDYGDDLGVMTSDPRRLRQVMLNLLSNAAKFTKRGRVAFSVGRKPGEGSDSVTITVRDTGIGITQANLARLFNDFAQAEASTSSRFGGTGLGLAVSRSLCHMMGGDIVAESEYGKGSCFRVILPATLGALPQAQPDARPAPHPAPAREPALAEAV